MKYYSEIELTKLGFFVFPKWFEEKKLKGKMKGKIWYMPDNEFENLVKLMEEGKNKNTFKLNTLADFNKKIDELNAIIDKIMTDVIFHSGKFMSELPEEEREHLHELGLKRDAVVVERNKRFKKGYHVLEKGDEE